MAIHTNRTKTKYISDILFCLLQYFHHSQTNPVMRRLKQDKVLNSSAKPLDIHNLSFLGVKMEERTFQQPGTDDFKSTQIK